MKKKPRPEAAASQERAWLALAPYLDIDYSYRLAKRMEEFKTNPRLGYRTAGSQAEFATGEMLAAEMRSLGLEVSKDQFRLDGWDFHHARLSWQDDEGQIREAELGGYQTEFDTGGPREMCIRDRQDTGRVIKRAIGPARFRVFRFYNQYPTPPLCTWAPWD